MDLKQLIKYIYDNTIEINNDKINIYMNPPYYIVKRFKLCLIYSANIYDCYVKNFYIDNIKNYNEIKSIFFNNNYEDIYNNLSYYPRKLKRYFFCVLESNNHIGRYYNYTYNLFPPNYEYKPPREIIKNLKIAIFKNISDKLLNYNYELYKFIEIMTKENNTYYYLENNLLINNRCDDNYDSDKDIDIFYPLLEKIINNNNNDNFNIELKPFYFNNLIVSDNLTIPIFYNVPYILLKKYNLYCCCIIDNNNIFYYIYNSLLPDTSILNNLMEMQYNNS